MVARSLGNHAPGFKGRQMSGIGTAAKPMGLGWDSFVATDSGDQLVIQLSSIVIGDINFGVFFQASSAITVEFTLSNVATATDPDPAANAATIWGNSLSVPAGQITQAPVLFTACRITFTGPCEGYIGVR
jgi:hypothetical protein